MAPFAPPTSACSVTIVPQAAFGPLDVRITVELARVEVGVGDVELPPHPTLKPARLPQRIRTSSPRSLRLARIGNPRRTRQARPVPPAAPNHGLIDARVAAPVEAPAADIVTVD